MRPLFTPFHGVTMETAPPAQKCVRERKKRKKKSEVNNRLGSTRTDSSSEFPGCRSVNASQRKLKEINELILASHSRARVVRARPPVADRLKTLKSANGSFVTRVGVAGPRCWRRNMRRTHLVSEKRRRLRSCLLLSSCCCCCCPD